MTVVLWRSMPRYVAPGEPAGPSVSPYRESSPASTVTPAWRPMASAVLGGSDDSEKIALTPVALILVTRSPRRRPDSSAEVSKLGMIEPTKVRWYRSA